MPEIADLTVEKQAGPEMCWAATVKCVLGKYMSPYPAPDQLQLRARFGKTKEDGTLQESNSVITVLKQIGAFDGFKAFDADFARESPQYTPLARVISWRIQHQQPVICAIEGTGSAKGFLHALVIWKIEEQPEPLLHMKDPARGGADVVAGLWTLLKGEWKYASFGGEYASLNVYARQFIFTKKPSVYDLAAAGLFIFTGSSKHD